MKQKTFLLFLLAACLAFSNCKKSKPNTPPPVDNTQKNYQLLLGRWKLTQLYSDKPYDWNGDGRSETDILANASPCDQEVILSFSTLSRGFIKPNCQPTVQDFTWLLSNYGNRIEYTIPTGAPTKYDITSLDVNKLTVKYTVQLPPPIRDYYLITRVYTKL